MTGVAVAFLALLISAIGLAGCSGPQPFVRAGDAKSVDVMYSGDPATALPLARKHCAEYALVPHLVYRDADEAQFDCVSPPRAP